jgi:hypothetical protein
MGAFYVETVHGISIVHWKKESQYSSPIRLDEMRIVRIMKDCLQKINRAIPLEETG